VGDQKYPHLHVSTCTGKSLWRMTQGSSLWCRVMQSKYFPSKSIEEWIKEPRKSTKESIVWKALVRAFPMVGKCLAWKIGNGRSVRLGEDP
jgi:hypothetical protein